MCLIKIKKKCEIVQIAFAHIIRTGYDGFGMSEHVPRLGWNIFNAETSAITITDSKPIRIGK